MKKIKYWKVIETNLPISTAVSVLKTHKCKNVEYEYLAIRFKDHIIEDYGKIPYLTFNFDEATKFNWEVIIPDTDTEDILYKCRKIVKDEHFLNSKHEVIDNLNITQIFQKICDYIINHTNEKTMYRCIKFIVENKLYKKL